MSPVNKIIADALVKIAAHVYHEETPVDPGWIPRPLMDPYWSLSGLERQRQDAARRP